MMAPVPPRPADAYFDDATGVWVLSRYVDVLAAFRDTRLWTINIGGADQMEVRDDSGKLAARAAMQEALAQPKVAHWQSQFQVIVEHTIAELPDDRPVDLLREFAQPCCLSLAAVITGLPAADVPKLRDLGAAAFGGTGAEPGSEAQLRAKSATAEMEQYFANAGSRMGEPTFVGTSQTMARLLTNGWLALIGNPSEYRRLLEQPDIMPTAVEELLRYAGIVPTLYRRAYADLTIGTAGIANGQRVHLKIASANRDPEQFADPGRLDLGRRAVNHLALGIGRNSCVGNLVIRMASAVTTGAIVRAFPEARVVGDIDWHSTPSFAWPGALPVLFRRSAG